MNDENNESKRLHRISSTKIGILDSESKHIIINHLRSMSHLAKELVEVHK